MEQIRLRTFETNSSSVHTLSIHGNDAFIEKVNNKKLKTIEGCFGEFGWGVEKHKSVEMRLSYLLTDLADQAGTKDYMEPHNFEEDKNKFLNYKYFIWTNEAVKAYTGNDIYIDWEGAEKEKYFHFGYIDHQSAEDLWPNNIEGKFKVADILFDFWSSDKETFKKNITDFIFNNKYEIKIDNDNH